MQRLRQRIHQTTDSFHECKKWLVPSNKKVPYTISFCPALIIFRFTIWLRAQRQKCDRLQELHSLFKWPNRQGKTVSGRLSKLEGRARGVIRGKKMCRIREKAGEKGSGKCGERVRKRTYFYSLKIRNWNSLGDGWDAEKKSEDRQAERHIGMRAVRHQSHREVLYSILFCFVWVWFV